jgi:hypothetical protein
MLIEKHAAASKAQAFLHPTGLACQEHAGVERNADPRR